MVISTNLFFFICIYDEFNSTKNIEFTNLMFCHIQFLCFVPTTFTPQYITDKNYVCCISKQNREAAVVLSQNSWSHVRKNWSCVMKSNLHWCWKDGVIQ
jgi:hypothetical protein